MNNIIKAITGVSGNLLRAQKSSYPNLYRSTIIINGSFNRTNQLHTSTTSYDLMEFFDDKKNWDKKHIQVGRSWRTEELRIKSNQDLHKLWYVLLKEKNMLLTMEKVYKDEYRAFPNPERIDKVEESMENIEAVVQERNKAYWQLETNETGERPSGWFYNSVGLYQWRLCYEHEKPKPLRKRMYLRRLPDGYQEKFVEKGIVSDHKLRKMYADEVMGILRTFENVDIDALKQKYPMVNVDLLKKKKQARGNWLNKY